MPTWLTELLGKVGELPSLISSVEALVSGIANEIKSGSGTTNPLGIAEDIGSAVVAIHNALVSNTPHSDAAVEAPAETTGAEQDGEAFRASEAAAPQPPDEAESH